MLERDGAESMASVTVYQSRDSTAIEMVGIPQQTKPQQVKVDLRTI